MQEKKGISTAQPVENTKEDLLTIAIEDGYQEGDRLNINLGDVTYSWDAENHSLSVYTSENNISNILNKIYLEGSDGTERFLDIKYTAKDGAVFDLDECSIMPISDETKTRLMEYTSKYENIFKNNSIENVLSVDFKEEKGADFLMTSVEEILPFQLQQQEQGDVYKILKDSLFESKDVLEISGYNINSDKVSLEDFTEKIGDSFNYNVSRNEENLQVNIYDSGHEYSIILKDAAVSVDDAKLDDILQNVISDKLFDKS